MILRLRFLFMIVAGFFGNLLTASEFTVVAYNVENLFDVDGVALYEDYEQVEPATLESYTRRKFLTKLQHVVLTLQAFNVPGGPEVILFQELEADFTPKSGLKDLRGFLREYSTSSVESMLTHGWRAPYAGIPSHAWLLKAMADQGLTGYNVVVAPAKDSEMRIAHTCAVFSKFPINEVNVHPLQQARDILEVELEIAGASLWVYSNHWKSGASNPDREPIRVQNACVLRELLDARLAEDPYADIIIGGDLNSHYNHSRLFPAVQTGVNDVLGSQGDERAIHANDGPDLYNLWFELLPDERYSEVWKGRRGTLMHLLITRGLYDGAGISYLDGSFNKLGVAGVNADALGRPLKWNFFGETGGGFSDHFPLYARFSTLPFKPRDAPSVGTDALSEELPLDYRSGVQTSLENGDFLNVLADAELGAHVGKVFQVEAEIAQRKPLSVTVDGVEWSVFIPDRDLFNRVIRTREGQILDLVVTLQVYRGKRQFVVEGIR